jgi:hypothetical protein
MMLIARPHAICLIAKYKRVMEKHDADVGGREV